MKGARTAVKVLTAEQMAYVDRTAIERGTPGIELMRNAGHEVFSFIEKTFAERSGIVVLAGKGNNGGDGFRTAELLVSSGYKDVHVFLVGEKSSVRGDARTCMEACERAGCTVQETVGDTFHERAAEAIDGACLIIDALFGTGLQGDITGIAADIIGMVNHSHAAVVAVDIPSGVNASTGGISRVSVRADYTVTFGCLKVGHVLMPGRRLCGEVHIADIGFPADILDSVEAYGNTLSSGEAVLLLPVRPYDVHKGEAGRVFVLSGSVGMTGAATLVSKSAMRAGAGVVTLGCPASLNDILEVKCTEVMTLPLPEVRKKRCLSLRALGMVREAAKKADVVAVGPGLGVYHETTELVRRFIEHYEGRIVLDADGINAFKGEPGLLREARSSIIMTPHYGELSRLLGTPVEDIACDPAAAVIDASNKTGAVVLLKGSPTIIAAPGKEVWINGTGNEGMATAGMGDVLTGVITGFAAQGLSMFDAAVLGAFVHGLAGDYAADEKGMIGMMSGDVLELIPQTVKGLSNVIPDNS